MPAADLLLMKLQVVELNRKDAIDVAALLSTHRLDRDDADGVIGLDRVTSVLGDDWGFYTTFSDNLARLPAIVEEVDGEVAVEVSAACHELESQLEAAPKSRAFRMRARVGRRKRWYELPDESL
jgi:hypothetical protein